jgi:hypothetical protein
MLTPQAPRARTANDAARVVESFTGFTSGATCGSHERIPRDDGIGNDREKPVTRIPGECQIPAKRTASELADRAGE